jgi:hypothetical protein
VRRRELEALPSQATLDEIEEILSRVTNAADSFSRASEHYALASLNLGAVSRDLEAAQQDEHALREAAMTRRFWHALEPSCCPRCDAIVDESMRKREEDGHCSLCDSPVELENGSPEELPADDEENPNDLKNLELRVAALEADWEAASVAHDESKAARDSAEAALTASRALLQAPQVDTSARRRIEYQIEPRRTARGTRHAFGE